MKKSFIFDFDGLLVNTEVVSLQLYQELLAEYNYTFSRETYSENYSGKTAIGNMQNLIKNYDLPITVEEGLKKVAIREKEILEGGVALKNGAKELLSYLKKHDHKIALATSSTRERAIKIMKDHGIVDYFDDFVFAEDITKGKPNPDVFLKAAQKLGENPADCIVLEDSEAGIEAACNAGIAVICVPDMKRPDDAHLNKTLRTFDSLKEVIGFTNERKYILFDMDGVLVDTEPLHWELWKKTFADFGLDVSYENYAPCIGSTIKTLYGYIEQFYGVNFENVPEVAERLHQYLDEAIENGVGFPKMKDVPEVIRTLKDCGYHMAIASSSRQVYIKKAMDDLGITDCFDVLFSSQFVKNPKPAPDIFLAAAEKMGADPAECVVVEDSRNGSLAAKAAGMACLGYANPNSGNQDLSAADDIFYPFIQLKDYFL